MDLNCSDYVCIYIKMKNNLLANCLVPIDTNNLFLLCHFILLWIFLLKIFFNFFIKYIQPILTKISCIYSILRFESCYIQMNSIVFLTICALIFTQVTSIDCGQGYYASSSYNSFPNGCFQCRDIFSECTSGLVQGTKVGDSRVVGYKYAANGDFVPYCKAANNYYNTFYNKNDNICELDCKDGCKGCYIDYDYCTMCHPGYVWKDYTCTPIAVGLQSASLALLVISLVFAIIGCAVVIRAKKN